MARKKKTLLYEMYCEQCGKDPTKSMIFDQTWNIIPMKCECGGRIKIEFDKPYYLEDRTI